MSARSIVLIAAALLLAVGTMFFVRSWLATNTPTDQPVQAQQIVQTEVLVARSDLPAGTLINEQHLRWQSWPDDDVPETYMIRTETDQKSLYGSVVRRGIASGQPIIQTQIVKPGDRGFLAAVLKPGFRAFSIKVSATTGISGLVFPGDRVDLILIHTLPADEGGGPPNKVSETFLRNVRVLAIDQTIDDQNGEPRVAKTATLEVTPKQAEVLAVADDIGRIALSLRSLAKDEAELKRIVERGEVIEEGPPSRAKSYTRDAEASALVGFSGPQMTVVRGGESQKMRFK